MSAQNVLIKMCRLSFFYGWTPDKNEDGKEKYRSALMIPKSDKGTYKKLVAARAAAVEDGIERLKSWKGKAPKGDRYEVIKDGDEMDDPAYHDHWIINASSSEQPGIVDKYGDDIPENKKHLVYSGAWCAVTVRAYPYDTKANGVAFALNNIMKLKDDTKFGGKPSAKSDFADFEAPDFDDDDADDDDEPVRKPAKKKLSEQRKSRRPVEEDDDEDFV